VGSKRQRNVQTAAQVFLGVNWLSSGVSKCFDLAGFESVLEQQKVVAHLASLLSVVVPGAEVVLGFMIVAAGSTRLCGWLCLVSGAAIVVLSVYIASVPAAVLKATGCGCQGVATVTELHSHSGVLVRNGVLLALHVSASMGRLGARTAKVKANAAVLRDKLR